MGNQLVPGCPSNKSHPRQEALRCVSFEPMRKNAEPGLTQELEKVLKGEIQETTVVRGGDINDAALLQLTDGRKFFLKTNDEAPPGMFEVEAQGLSFLRAGLDPAAPLVVPEVVAWGSSFLLLEYLEPRRVAGDQEEALGRGLAALHQNGPDRFGLEHDNFIGTLPQDNRPTATWAEFYGERRLRAQLEMPAAKRCLGTKLRQRIESLIENLDELVGPPEPPARLHGDLWGGNWMSTHKGPAILDPAVYGGHREMDLAMMRLFGGFSTRTFSAYEEVAPLGRGHEERVPLFQLYPLLVHVNLFGTGYVGQVQAVVGRYTQ